jgi:vesicle coat complex subunit
VRYFFTIFFLQWEVCAALSAAGRLIGADTIPAVLKLVKDLVQHKEAHVRKKVLIALHGFLQKSPDSVQDFCVDTFKVHIYSKKSSLL